MTRLSAGIFMLSLIAIAGCALPHPQTAPASEAACVPSDQDHYVFRPARLQVVQGCIRAAGTVTAVGLGEADGDTHLQLHLDTPYQKLLTPGNQSTAGDLVVEAVCVYIPPHIEALRLCASDPDPYAGPWPRVGDHIWVEGRYVLDLWHDAQEELHPLYRWGIIQP